MAQKPDWKNMKVGGATYTKQVEEGTAELLRAREEKRRAFLAARAATSTPQSGSLNNAPLRDNRLERVTAARNSSSLFLTPEPEAQAVARQLSRDDEMIDAPSSPDEPLAARRRPSESNRRSTLNEEEIIKTEKTSASESSSRRLSGAAMAPMLPAVAERSATAYLATQVTDRKAPPRQGTKVPRSMMPNPLKRPNQAGAPSSSNKRRSPSDEVASPADQTANTSLTIPQWYRDERPTQRDIASSRSVCDKLSQVKIFLRKLDNAQKQNNTDTIKDVLEQIRNWIHDMEHLTVQGVWLKIAKMLDVQNLPKLFHNLPGSSQMTFDIIADAKALYRKWARADFDADVLRGVMLKTKALDDKYTARVDFHFYGTGDLVSGQWWPLRICTLRDGAHGASQGGISGEGGEGGKGAYSIVVAGQYDDNDQGETLEYCGTPDQTKSGNMTEATKLLRDSFRTKNPVRVLRSGNNIASKSSGGSNDKKNVYLPASGYRYDGVYDVDEEKLLDAKEQLWTFKLKRQGNQDPIRYSGPYARPSMQDLQEWQKVKQYARHE